MASFQTIDEFMKAPFGVESPKSNELERMYQKLKTHHMIKISGYTQVEDDHLLHLSIGSETNPKESYDVVLLFFTDNEELKKKRDFREYYIKFFSNSPSFIYQYAALYKQHGFLIDTFYEKMDQEYADKLPEKINKDHTLSYDKSIYSACRFLLDIKAGAFNKFLHALHRKTPEAFTRDIRNFQDVKLSQEIRSIDKKINKELEENKKRKKENKKQKKSSFSGTQKRGPVKNTLSTESSLKKSNVVKSSKRTNGSISSGVVRKKAKKSTS